MIDNNIVEKSKECLDILNNNWEYKRKQHSYTPYDFYYKIENYTASELISKEDKFDFRKTLDKNLFDKAKKGDFIVLLSLQTAPRQYISKSKKDGFSYNFSTYTVIIYYPLKNILDFFNYSVSD